MKNPAHNRSRLADYLALIPQDRTFLVTAKSQYTFGDVTALCQRFAAEHAYLANSNCAVTSDDRESLALFFPAIDSVCQTVFLQPNDIEGAESDFYTSAGIDYVIKLADCNFVSITAVAVNDKVSYAQQQAYLLATSGTTGTPKLANYTLDTLLATAKLDVNRGKDFNWGLAYDLNRFAGLQVYLQSAVSGATLVVPSDAMTIAELVQLFTKSAVNALSATPSFWRKLLMDPFHTDIPLQRITLGGEISNQSVLTALSRSFPQSAIIHIYASTEAGVGFVVKDQREGFPLTYLDDDQHIKCQLKVCQGVLWIKSTNGCTQLLKGKLEVDEQGFVNTGDMVNIDGDRVFFLGRESGSINVGGNKVMPEKVEAILEMHPSVLMATVFAKSNSVLGALVACEIILAPDAKHIPVKELKRELLSFCREKLETFEVPALVKVVDAIKVNSTGKKVRS
ncbi:AMP-dependent synthetase [Photobacterium jeanii]|uniref:Long-chain-fatty-acid--CoA ligase n=1 Tax=Photobacterium jeanii TaxID=858640 RepID=A0A178KQ59_9GAMM|nr:class I adenylate-forming enzyme family protein [Photobacterium jeanii]OAN19075.1 AMP-dependent synthetase [Photobacterium jeanii]PST87741.1 long-chain fatty acid--CoA ligase [Photobacterium jeanii]